MKKLYIGSDNLLKITGLKNALTDAYLNAATVTAVVKDPGGDTITAGDNITLNYVAGSDGTYAGIVPDTADIENGAKYDVEITANAGAGLVKKFVIKCEAEYADD